MQEQKTKNSFFTKKQREILMLRAAERIKRRNEKNKELNEIDELYIRRLKRGEI